MANGADGSIIIDTELDNTGFRRGSRQMENAINSLNDSANQAGRNMAASVQNVIPALRETVRAAKQTRTEIMNNLGSGGFSRAIAEMQKQAGAIANQFTRLGDAETLGVKSDAQIARFSLNVTKARDGLALLIGQLNRFTNVPINTDEWQRLQEEYNRIDAALGKLYEKQYLMQQLGVKENSTAYQRLTIQIDKVAEAANNAWKKLIALERSGEYAQMGGDTAQYQEMAQMIQELATQLEHYEEVAAGFNVIQQPAQDSTDALENVDKELKQKAVDANSARTGLSGLGRALSSIGETAFRAVGALAKLSFSALINGAKMAGSAVKKLATNVSSLAWRGITNGVKAAGAGISGLVEKLKGLHNQSNKNILTNNGLVKSLFSIKNMLLSRIKRTFISSIFNSMKEGMTTLAKYSSSFNAAMSNIQNSMSGLSGNLAVSAGNLISAFAPAITTLINWISRAISYVNALFALLGGKTTYTVAKNGTEDYAKSLDKSKKAATGASNAVKELNRQVYSFDELNKESDKNDNSGGGGGGSGDNSGVTFEERALASLPASITDIFNRIKKAIAGEKWEEVGQIVAEGLNNIVTAADKWITGVFEPNAIKWVDRIARVLNGLVSGINRYNIGKLVGDGLNAIVRTVNTFLTRFDFEALGKGLAEGIRGIFETVDWAGLGDTVALKFNSVVDLLHGAITNAPWDMMAEKIALRINSFLDGVNWGKLILTAWLGIKSITITISNTIARIEFASWAQKVSDGLNSVFNPADWTEIGSSVSAGFNSVISGLETFIAKINWSAMADSIAAGVNGLLNGINWVKLIATVWLGIKSIALTLSSVIEQIDFAGLATNIATGINGIFNKADWVEIGNSVSRGLNNVITGLKTLVLKIDWVAMAESIGSGANALLSKINWSDLVFTVLYGMISIAAALISGISYIDFKAIGDGIADGLNKVFGKDEEGNSYINWSKIGSDFGTAVVNAVEGVTSFLSTIHWSNIGQALIDAFHNIPWGAVATSIMGFLSQALHSAIELIFGKDVADTIITKEVLDSWERETERLLKNTHDNVQGFANALEPITISNNLGTTSTEIEVETTEVLRAVFARINELIGQESEKSSMEMAWAVRAIASECENELTEVEPELAEKASVFMQTIAEAGTNDKETVINAFKGIGIDITDQLANAIISGQVPVETAVMGLTHGMSEKMLTSITDEELMNGVVDFYESIGEKSGSTLGEAAVASADQGVISGINALESKADELVASLDIQDQQRTLESDNRGTAETGMQAVGEGVQAGTPNVQTAAEAATDAITNPFKGLPAETEAQALLMMQAVQAAISSGEPKATAAIATAAKAIVDRATKILNSGEGKTIGSTFITELIDGFTETQDSVINLIDTIASTIQNRANEKLAHKEGKKIGSQFLSGLLAGVNSVRSTLLSTAQSIADNAYSAFSGLLTYSAGYSMAAQICNGLVSGLYNYSSYVSVAAWNVAVAALDSARAALGIASPSKAFAEIGGYMMQGMENGLNDSRDDVTRTVSNIAEGIVNGLSDTPSLKVSADTLVTGIDGATQKLSVVAEMFQAIAEAIASMEGLNLPSVASGAFTPYKVRVGEVSGLDSESDRINTFTRNFDETMSDQRDVLREILAAILGLDLNVDGKSIERTLTSLQRDRIRAYGGA